jgi:LacI family transcriptional regulator, galactose operon repressor
VFIDRDDHPKIKCHRVLTDDIEVGRLATSHLIGLGHKAIAHIAAPPLVHAQRREEGYREMMGTHGLKIHPRWVVSGGFLQDQGYEAMQRLLKTAPEVTAVFAVNDPAAIGAMKACWEAGVRVPEDITIVGAGDIAHGDMLRVPLTTVSWSRRDLGSTAAKLILDQLEAHPTGPFERVIIPPRLIVRSSCGPPRKK